MHGHVAPGFSRVKSPQMMMGFSPGGPEPPFLNGDTMSKAALMRSTHSHLSVLASVLFLAGFARAESVVIEEIVARVNESVVTRTDLQRARDQLQQEYQQQYGDQAGSRFAAKEKDLLRDLIDQKLLVQRAKNNGISVENELIKRLDEMRQQMNLESMEDLEKAAQAQGISYEDFKDNMRNSMLTQRVIGEEVGRRMTMMPSEVAKYYEEHKQELEQPESVRLAEILVSTQLPAGQTETPEAEAARIAAAEAKAKSLLESIRKGAKFEEIAKNSSDGPTAAQGGDLGQFKRGALAAELEERVFNMKTGEITDVIRTKQGFIILKVLDHTQAGIPPLKEVEGQIQERLYYQKLQPALREFLTKLREEAYIDIKQGFVDSGASPNQTKPILASAVTKDDEKDKKRKKKLGIF
jgi:peptidyl-prolyl cis-trans isomerase SurA